MENVTSKIELFCIYREDRLFPLCITIFFITFLSLIKEKKSIEITIER